MTTIQATIARIQAELTRVQDMTPRPDCPPDRSQNSFNGWSIPAMSCQQGDAPTLVGSNARNDPG